MGFFNAADIQQVPQQAKRLSHCGRCGLAQRCITPRMEPTGQGERSVLFVAEAPGETEDRRGVQLVGDAGKLLRRELRSIGEDLDECWKTNAVICRPPGNRMKDVYIECCRPNLLRTVRELKPNVIVALGGSATQSLLPLDTKLKLKPATKWNGYTIPSPFYNAWICPTFHPSFIKRMDENPVLLLLFKEHLKQAFALASNPPQVHSLEDLSKQVEVIIDPKKGRSRMRDLCDAEGLLAFDYETTGLKPERKGHRIVTCSFCLDGEDTFACPIEEKSLGVLSRVLRNPKLGKIASNMKFEERWSHFFLGHGVENWYWDTMLNAHIIDNMPGITSLKFQAYVHFGVGDYDSHIKPYLHSSNPTRMNRIDKVELKSLLLYNGLDALLEYMLMEKQREVLH